MAAAQREVWTGAQLRRLLAERAGLHLSSASVSALLTRQPAQVKLETLAALCTALDCTPDDLIDVDTTPVPQPAARRGRPGKSRGPPAGGRCRRCEPLPALRPVRRPGQVPRPGPAATPVTGGRHATRSSAPAPAAAASGTSARRASARSATVRPFPGRRRPSPAASAAQQRRNAGHGLCNRCKLADPDWPFRYGASLAARMRRSRPGGRR